MKTEKNILIAFILNLSFSIFEFIGGIFTGSVAIMSDALHDIGDAIGIGVSYFFEKKSKKQPDNYYTYGYARYSVIGGMITTLILIIGSIAVIFNAVNKIINPSVINYNGMIGFAVIGTIVNFAAAYFTHEGDSINQKAVNLHMLEDVLGWIVVLIGATVMKFTDIKIIDPIMSIAIAVFILLNALKNLKNIFFILLEKTPDTIDVDELKNHLLKIDGVLDVHHIHLWSMDGQSLYATMHIKTNCDYQSVKFAVRKELSEHSITHSTLELESKNEPCYEQSCRVVMNKAHHCYH